MDPYTFRGAKAIKGEKSKRFLKKERKKERNQWCLEDKLSSVVSLYNFTLKKAESTGDVWPLFV